jgi:hypothetical protein
VRVIVMVRSKVFDLREFLEWFARKISEKMGCQEVVVTGVILRKNFVVIDFLCNGHNYTAEIRRYEKFDVSVYARVYKNGKLVRIKKLDRGKEPAWVYAYHPRYKKNYALLDNVLFRVTEGVKIKIYETDIFT